MERLDRDPQVLWHFTNDAHHIRTTHNFPRIAHIFRIRPSTIVIFLIKIFISRTTHNFRRIAHIFRIRPSTIVIFLKIFISRTTHNFPQIAYIFRIRPSTIIVIFLKIFDQFLKIQMKFCNIKPEFCPYFSKFLLKNSMNFFFLT